MSQTHLPSQIIISDNSSDLGGLVISKDFFRSSIFDSAIQLLLLDAREHLGISKNSNFGLSFANQNFCHVLHSDDQLQGTDFYKKSLSYFELDENLTWGIARREFDGYVREPIWTSDSIVGFNRLGGPSTLIAKRDAYPKYNPDLKFFLDVEIYSRLFVTYGPPAKLNKSVVSINTSGPRVSNTISSGEKERELLELIWKSPFLDSCLTCIILRNLDLPLASITFINAVELDRKIPLHIKSLRLFFQYLVSIENNKNDRVYRILQQVLSKGFMLFLGKLKKS
jgi:hypothetical protein